MIIKKLYLFLFFLTPLVFSSYNSELFELPKMYFVYGLTLIILISHLLNYLRGLVPLFRRTPLDWPLGLFLLFQTISTFFSIDLHTSIFGYYSRLNGGLLSLLAYAMLYWILVIYLDEKFRQNIIKISLVSGFLVAVYGILEHFGIDKNVWVQDVQSRVFSTLGQPNWLAAYLCILLPFALDKFFKSITNLHKVCFLFLVSCFFVCLLFTKSKSGIIAAIISIALYVIARSIATWRSHSGLPLRQLADRNDATKLLLIPIVFVFLSLLINNPIKDYVFFTRQSPSVGGLQNTLLITPSEDIRKIVWQGSLDLWRQYPLFGTGPETFAYSYYWTRPASHNLTSEWDFLYNKAHNEYLNYLATTGTFGFVSYLLLIFSIIFFLKSPLLSPSVVLSLSKDEGGSKGNLEGFNLAILASFISLLITNFAGFSVVITSLYFFLLPALAIADPNPLPPPSTPKKISKIIAIIFILFSFFALSKTLFYYLADITYAAASTLDDNQKYSQALTQIKLSNFYRPNEPLYLIKQANLSAKMAIISKSQPSSNTQAYIDKSVSLLAQATNISPFSLNLWKEKAQVYYYLSTIDSQYYLLALDSLTKATYLAPTDAKSFFMLAEFYENIDKFDESIANYEQAIKLKPNYDHALFNLGKIYLAQKKYDLAKTNFEKTLSIAPTNIDAKNYLNQISTASAVKKSVR